MLLNVRKGIRNDFLMLAQVCLDNQIVVNQQN